ncbi:hypothetical protein ACEQ8H_004407 [Pleosporales sp. CAS-2024a]
MAGSGVNLAITKDGGAYNKLQRPQDYLTPTVPPPPRKTMPLVDAQSLRLATKRKHGLAATKSKHKRAKLGHEEHNELSTWTDQPSSWGTKAGMKLELPNLDGDCSSDDSTSEALFTYLRSVKSEASAIPDLLVTNSLDMRDSTHNDQHAVFREGTYIAIDRNCDTQDGDETHSEELSLPGPQDRSYELLLKRFYHLRATLAEALHGNIASEATPDLGPVSQSWLDSLDTDFPRLERVKRVEGATLYTALKKCTLIMSQATWISRQFSCWLWTLLAIVGDVGTLDNDKISHVRDVGREAGLLRVRLQRLARRDQHIRDGSDQNADVESTSCNGIVASSESNSTSEGGAATEIEEARARLLTQLGDRLVQPQLPATGFSACPSPSSLASARLQGGADTHCDWTGGERDVNTSVTIDMVLTVVAECFGQRDLLEYRQQW